MRMQICFGSTGWKHASKTHGLGHNGERTMAMAIIYILWKSSLVWGVSNYLPYYPLGEVNKILTQYLEKLWNKFNHHVKNKTPI